MLIMIVFKVITKVQQQLYYQKKTSYNASYNASGNRLATVCAIGLYTCLSLLISSIKHVAKEIYCT